MAMRGAEVHQTPVLSGSLNHPALSAPDLADRLSLRFVDFLTPPRVRHGLRSGCDRCRILEVLVRRDQGPQAARHFVCEGYGHQHTGLLGQHSVERTAVQPSLSACLLHDCHRTGDV